MAPKIRIVLASHGEQARGMMNTVQMVLGPQENLTAHCLYPEQTRDDLTARLKAEADQYGAENVIFMTDLMYGSPFNAVNDLTRDYDIYHISGTNLAMLMTAIMERDNEDATCESVCEAVMEAAAGSIVDVRKLLSEASSDDDEDDL